MEPIPEDYWRCKRLLKPCPIAGNGVHFWFFGAACTLLRHGIDECLIEEILEDESADCGRDIQPNEIPNAIESAILELCGERESQVSHLGSENVRKRFKWSPYDALKAYQRARERWAWSITRWQKESPVSHAWLGSEEVLGAFIRVGEFFCCGETARRFVTVPINSRSDFLGAENYAFCVLNPMKGPLGRTKGDGHLSARCDDNVKERRILSVEFDFDPEALGLEVSLHIQAALHRYLASILPIALLVYSGSKSLHGTYTTLGSSEADLRLFYDEAVSLGADYALWCPSQFTRMPGGTHANGRRQTIYYFDPGVFFP